MLGLFSHNIWENSQRKIKEGSAESYTIKEYNNFPVNIPKEVEEKDEEKVPMSAPNKKKSAVPVTAEDFENNNNTANFRNGGGEQISKQYYAGKQASRDYIMPPVLF